MSDLARTLPLILVTAVATAAATLWIAQPAPEAGEASAAETALLAAQDDRERLQQRLEQLERRLAAAPAAPAEAVRTPILDDAAIARAVEAWMEQHGEELAAAAGAAAEGAADEGALPAFADADSAFEALFADGLDFDQRAELWNRIRESGLADQVLEALEQYAEDNPADPDVQLLLGEGYLNKVFEVGNTPEAGAWAMKADAAFDQALQADPAHWEARFTKAVSLSNWPPFLGKQNEAIQHFELLVDQQGSSAAIPAYADTYLILGNLYQQTGRAEDALRVWRQGAALFPGREDLLGQISAVDG